MEEILRNKITEFGKYLLTLTEDEKKKSLITNKLLDLKYYEILLFITFLNEERKDAYIQDFVSKFQLEQSDELIEKTTEFMNYFIEVKKLLNENTNYDIKN